MADFVDYNMADNLKNRTRNCVTDIFVKGKQKGWCNEF